MSINAPFPAGFSVILLAGGSGERAGFGIPKQQALLAGRPVLSWSFEAFANHPACQQVVLVGGPDSQRLVDDQPILLRATAGSSRRLSVASGLAALDGASADTVVLIHDSARPGVTHDVINRLVAAIDDSSAGAIPILPVADTLIAEQDNVAGDVVDRSAIARVQTPQAFRLGALRAAHENWSGAEPTDDAQMVRSNGGTIALVPGEASLHKLTWADDIAILSALMNVEEPPVQQMRTAIGQGYDVHRLVPGKPLWLCGIEISHSHGLSGHSDADVALHALTDAILGALAEGDIGQHFPPSDAKWSGAASHQFARFAADRVSARCGVIDHVDLTIIAEAPKVGPHRDAMRGAIAEILGIPIAHISVKATTTEGLGFAGRREGIAAQAITILRLPV